MVHELNATHPEAKESVVKEEFKDAKHMNQIHVQMIQGISEEDIFSTFSSSALWEK